MKTNRRIVSSYTFNNILNYIFGLASVIGLGINIAYSYSAFTRINTLQPSGVQTEVITSLSISIIILILTFIVMALFYAGRITLLSSELKQLPLINSILARRVSDQSVIIHNTAYTFHNIIHYYRTLLYSIDDFLERSKAGMTPELNKECTGLLLSSDRFFLMLLTNLKTHFDILTGDDCALCIKLLKEDNIKTFFRDPVSYRKRKTADYDFDGNHNIYKVSKNYAFQLVLQTEFKKAAFICDDLQNHNEYYNSNPDWQKHYNACAVIPISVRKHDSKRTYETLGFLCVDNRIGNFEQRRRFNSEEIPTLRREENLNIEDTLSAIGDLLFNLLFKFGQLAEYANTNLKKDNIPGERVTIYTNWS